MKSKTIGETAIPTATHGWNPVIGCKRCQKGKCAASGFTCWAAAYMKRYWKQWAKWETGYRPGENPPFNRHSADETERRLKSFTPVPLNFQFEKEFPKKPSIIAVGWMSDLAHWESDWVDAVLTKIRKDNLERKEKGLPLHVFQFLTKNPLVYGERLFPDGSWLGFTATTQREYEERMWTVNADGEKDGYSVGKLNRENCKTFVYLEPLLEGINLKIDKLTRTPDWVIAGGQNGPGAVPVPLGWFRELRDQCKDSGIPFFFKGHGEWRPWETNGDYDYTNNFAAKTVFIDPLGGVVNRSEDIVTYTNPGEMIKVKDEHSHLLDGVEWHQFPEVTR